MCRVVPRTGGGPCRAECPLQTSSTNAAFGGSATVCTRHVKPIALPIGRDSGGTGGRRAADVAPLLLRAFGRRATRSRASSVQRAVRHRRARSHARARRTAGVAERGGPRPLRPGLRAHRFLGRARRVSQPGPRLEGSPGDRHRRRQAAGSLHRWAARLGGSVREVRADGGGGAEPASNCAAAELWSLDTAGAPSRCERGAAGLLTHRRLEAVLSRAPELPAIPGGASFPSPSTYWRSPRGRQESLHPPWSTARAMTSRRDRDRLRELPTSRLNRSAAAQG